MNNGAQPFNELLEEYVLQVAETYIADVKVALQTQLIRLFIEIGNEAVDATKE
ncbi:hypothetical protein BH09BAC4_BH09BAC4_02100 [soil metagenome]